MRYIIVLGEPGSASRSRALPSRLAISLIELLVAVGVIAVLLGLLLPAVQRVRARASTVRCENNLRQIGLGAQAHHSDHGWFPSGGWEWWTPPNYTQGVPAVGRDQRAGWGFQVLPYLEARTVWESGPRRAIAAVLPTFFCPARRTPQTISFPDEYTPPVAGPGENLTHGLCDYAASNLTGTGAIRQYDPVRITEITDGTSSTLLLAEKRLNLAFLGTSQPDDNEGYTTGFDEDTVRTTEAPPAPDFRGEGSGGQRFGASHPGTFFAAFCDGSVRPIRYTVSPRVFVLLGNRADGQPVGLDD